MSTLGKYRYENLSYTYFWDIEKQSQRNDLKSDMLYGAKYSK